MEEVRIDCFEEKKPLEKLLFSMIPYFCHSTATKREAESECNLFIPQTFPFIERFLLFIHALTLFHYR